MAVRHYHSTDTGSPGRSLTGANINRLRQILRACLVDGYQGKPGAGWRIVHEHTRGFSLQNGPSTGIINFVQNSSADNPDEVLQVYLLETVTSTSAALLSGDNLRSGPWYQGSSVTTRHTINAYWPLFSGLSTLTWSVMADERSCILTLIGSASAVTGFNSFASLSLYFGEIASDNGLSGAATFVAVGGQLSTSSAVSQDGGTLGGGSTTLRDMRTGLAIAGGYTDCYSPEIADGNSISTPAVVLGTTQVVPAQIVPSPLRAFSASGGFVGRFRGLLADGALKRFGLGATLRTLGLSEVIDSLGKPVTVGGLVLAPFGNAHYQYLASPDPAYW